MPEPDAVAAPEPAPPLDGAVPVGEIVEPLGAQEEPPAIDAVPPWEWRSSSPLVERTGSSSWEPTPFASFAVASPRVEHPAPLPVPPALSLPGAIAPSDTDPTASHAPRAAAPARPVERAASTPPWEWRSSSPLVERTGSSSWEPTPFASFAVASPRVEHPAPLPPPALSLPGAIAPSDTDPTASHAPRAAAPARPVERAASTPPWTITLARVLLLVCALGAIALVAYEMLLFRLTPADIVYPAFAPRWISSALFLVAAVVGLVLVARRAAAARVVVAAAAIVSVVLFGWMPTVFIPAMVGAAIVLAIPGSRPWFRGDR